MNAIKKSFRAGAAALALAAGVACASTAHADTVLLDVGKIDKPRTVTIAGLGNVLAGPVQFKAEVNGIDRNLLAWCVDVYHSITLKDYAPNLQYTAAYVPLTNDFAPVPKLLDPGDLHKVGLLANYGAAVFSAVPVNPGPFTVPKPVKPANMTTAVYNATLLAAWNQQKAQHAALVTAYNADVAARNTHLQAVQGAIWQLMSNRDVTSATFDLAFNNLVDDLSDGDPTNAFLSGFGGFEDSFFVLKPVQLYGGRNGTTPLALTQTFIVASVPEPGTWVMMIGGFGLAGAALRRRRAAPAAA